MNTQYQGEKTFDKRTILAIVLSTVVIAGFFILQGVFFPKSEPLPEQAATQPAEAPVAEAVAVAVPEATGAIDASAQFVATPADATGESLLVAAQPASVEPVGIETTYTLKTDRVEAAFTNKGGNLLSLKLVKHPEGKGFVNLFSTPGAANDGFSIAFGPISNDMKMISAIMDAKKIDERTIEFSGVFAGRVVGHADPVPFTLKKRFEFADGDYMFKLTVTIENSVNEPVPLNDKGVAYSLVFGPQIGPEFSANLKNGDYRKYFSYFDGKKREDKTGITADDLKWTSIVGKYFALVAIPYSLDGYTTTFNSVTDPKTGQINYLSFSRPPVGTKDLNDSYYFYFGPKTLEELGRYDAGDRNAFKHTNMKLQDAVDNGSWLPWLEDILKWIMNLFYVVVPNYGISIILLTLLIKLLTFPLTKKGSVAQVRMQTMQPKMQELQAKYKNDPQKLNAEMAAMYQKEGYNPLSGCLPMLIQIPMFMAMYGMFSNHFDLRGAMFIPGWIPDLSRPEFLFQFEPVQILFWSFSAIRLLPFIYLGSQFLYGLTTTQPSGQGAGQMKFMLYGMPIMFFFIMYDTPSGLLVYWTFSNLFTLAQQLLIKRFVTHRHLYENNGMKQAGATVVQSKKGKRR